MSYCWYFTQEDIREKTPSREEGVSPSIEARYRKDGARFIINASNTLGLRYDTMATGVVFFHRFFMVQSFRQFDRWVVGASCLLLAGKVEETPKKCKDILKVTRSLLNDQQFSGFGANPKEELLTHERILLQTIKFELQLEHPYSYLLKFAKELKGEKSKIEKLVQMAWTFVNDSLCTTLCLQWEPQAIAVAFLYLAGKLTKFDLQGLSQSKSRSWWRQFVDTLDFHDLESICHQVLDIYGERDSDKKKSELATEEVGPTTAQQQTPPTTAMATPPTYVTGNVPSTTPTQGQLLAVHHSQHHYPSNHHSPSPVPPPPHGVAVPVAPPTCTASVIQPQAQGGLSSLQQSQMASYVAGRQAYTLADPLQALQAIRPVTNSVQLAQGQGTASTSNTIMGLQLPIQTTTAIPYSTLTVSVGNTTALPRAPMVHQSFSQLPGQQQIAYQQPTALGGGGTLSLQKNLSGIPSTVALQQSTLGTGVATTYQLLAGVGGVGGTGIQSGVMAQTGTGIRAGTQTIGNMRTGQLGIAQPQQQTLGQIQQNYLTPPPTKRTAYDLLSYHVQPTAGVLQTNILSQNIAAASGGNLNQTALTNVQQLTKPLSLLPQTSNSLTMKRVHPTTLIPQQQATSTLYLSNSQNSAGTPLQLSAVIPSQLPGAGMNQQVSALSAMTQLSARGVTGATAGALPGHLHSVMGAAAGTPVRSALPQPQPPATARPQAGGYGLQQSYGASATGRGAGWGTR